MNHFQVLCLFSSCSIFLNNTFKIIPIFLLSFCFYKLQKGIISMLCKKIITIQLIKKRTIIGDHA
ncbi:Uncharacterised protein [Segatella copri]|nr:Uncharacterised protein [Segatella copri]